MMRRKPYRDRTRINHAIRVPEVRCIDENGHQIGVIPTREALRLAQERGYDLVEVAPQAKPPVCRIMDYGKYKYEMSKRARQARRHQAATRLKEVQFHPNVAEHDYQTKIKHTRQFLSDGHPVRVTVRFRGREMVHKEIGHRLLDRVVSDCADLGRTDQPKRDTGRDLILLLTPLPRRSSAQGQQSSGSS